MNSVFNKNFLKKNREMPDIIRIEEEIKKKIDENIEKYLKIFKKYRIFKRKNKKKGLYGYW